MMSFVASCRSVLVDRRDLAGMDGISLMAG